ncbi:MAG: HEAT repeat domain-containing protein [archaeon]
MRRVRARFPNATKEERRELLAQRFERAWKKYFSNVKRYTRASGLKLGRDIKYINQFVRSLEGDRGKRYDAIIEMGRQEMDQKIPAFDPISPFAPSLKEQRYISKSFPYLAYAALRDPDPEYRERALMRVSMMVHPVTQDLLRYVAIHEPNANNRRLAFERLKFFNDEPSRAVLLRSLTLSKNRNNQRAILDSLGEIGTPETARQLFYYYTREGAPEMLRGQVHLAISRMAERMSEIREALERYPLNLKTPERLAVIVCALQDPAAREKEASDVADDLFDLEGEIRRMGLQKFVVKYGLIKKPMYSMQKDV